MTKRFRSHNDEGLRQHRPRKPFRFEYIKGKFSGMTKLRWYWRWFDEREKEEDGKKYFQELLSAYLKRQQQ